MENEHVNVTVDRRAGCEVELTVQVKPEASEKSYQEALKWVRQRVSLPGFRKGKAPVATIKKSHGDAIEEQWRDNVMNLAAREALKLTSIYPWSSEGVPRPKVEADDTFVFTFESEPEVPEVKKEDLQLQPIFAKEVTDEDVEKEIEALRKQHATYEAVDRAAEEGDFIRFDLEWTGVEPAEKVLDNYQMELKAGEAAGWLRQLVIGHKEGEVLDGETAPEEEDENKEAYERRPCRVTIRTIEKQVPATDEELVSKVKEESMEALRTETKARLDKQEKEKAEDATKELLWKTLFEKYPFDLPKSLVDAEEQATIGRMIEDARRQGASDEQIVAREKEMEAHAKNEVLRRLHAIFLARKIVANLNQQPTDKELEERALHLIMWESISQGRMPTTSPDPKRLQAYRHHAFLLIVRERVEQYLLS